MSSLTIALGAALMGLLTTSSSLLGAAVGLYLPISKRLLACILAFAAGTLISALAIDLGFQGTEELRRSGFSPAAAWALVAFGFACGAVVYYTVSLFLDRKGAAIRLPTRFRDYALGRKREENRELIALLAKCDLLRHLPPDDIEDILRCVTSRHFGAGDVIFRTGDPGDALYIVERGRVEVLAEPNSDAASTGAGANRIAELEPGNAFGEMALLSGQTRTATVRAIEATDLLEIAKKDFERLIASDRLMARAVEHLSHERAITNLERHGTNPSTWAGVASSSLAHLSRSEAQKMLTEAGASGGLAIADRAADRCRIPLCPVPHRFRGEGSSATPAIPLYKPAFRRPGTVLFLVSEVCDLSRIFRTFSGLLSGVRLKLPACEYERVAGVVAVGAITTSSRPWGCSDSS